jgi:PhnB protein
MQVEPYLSFNGRCEEALEFYKKALNAEVTALMRFSDAPQPMPPGMIAPGSEHKVMHCSMRAGASTIMASDGKCDGKPVFQGISLSIGADNTAHAQALFNALADGGQVQMPLAKTFFAERFGMVNDRFGVSWMVIAGA